MQSYTKCSDVRVNLMVTSMFLFMAGEILNFFVQMEIIIGAHKQILDLHSPCKEYSLSIDCLYIQSLGTGRVDVLLTMFLPGTQYEDRGISADGGCSHWRSWIIFSKVTINISVITTKVRKNLWMIFFAVWCIKQIMNKSHCCSCDDSMNRQLSDCWSQEWYILRAINSSTLLDLQQVWIHMCGGGLHRVDWMPAWVTTRHMATVVQYVEKYRLQ